MFALQLCIHIADVTVQCVHTYVLSLRFSVLALGVDKIQPVILSIGG